MESRFCSQGSQMKTHFEGIAFEVRDMDSATDKKQIPVLRIISIPL